jgi:hypothetical protein
LPGSFLGLGSTVGFDRAILSSFSLKCFSLSSVPSSPAACLNLASWSGFGFVMALEYIIYCDESSEKGPHYSDFYGGALVTSVHLDEVRTTLENKKKELHFNGEVKWNKVPGNKHYAKKYRDLMECFFDLVGAGKVKIRIMFRQNTIQSTHLTQEHRDQKFFILYYLFLKQGFGLDCSPIVRGGVRVRIYPDQIPDTKVKLDSFRNFLARMSNRPQLVERRIRVAKEDIIDVVSHDHVISNVSTLFWVRCTSSSTTFTRKNFRARSIERSEQEKKTSSTSSSIIASGRYIRGSM